MAGLLEVPVLESRLLGVWTLGEIGVRQGRRYNGIGGCGRRGGCVGGVGRARDAEGSGGSGIDGRNTGETSIGLSSNTAVELAIQLSEMIVGKDGAKRTLFLERAGTGGLKNRIGAIGWEILDPPVSFEAVLLEVLVNDDAEERREPASSGVEKIESSIAESTEELLLCADTSDADRLYSLFGGREFSGVERFGHVLLRGRELYREFL